MLKLVPYQKLLTSGARGVTPFDIDGQYYLAVPQLAEDNLNALPNMNGGNSDINSFIYQWKNNKFELKQAIATHGAESCAYFSIDDQHFLAVANIRTGSDLQYNFSTDSTLYVWKNDEFVPMQTFATFAAKHCHAFAIRERHFLMFAEGVYLPNMPFQQESCSNIYEWNGSSFIPFQKIDSKWAYNCSFFSFNGSHFLACADHVKASVLYKWDGKQFNPVQEFSPNGGGRHFVYLQIGQDYYLALANLIAKTILFKWDGSKFIPVQDLAPTSARQLSVIKRGQETFLFLTKFISGNPTQPITVQASLIFQWQNNQFTQIGTYQTSGGTQASIFSINNEDYLAVANSLSADIRFRAESNIYKIHYSLNL